MLEIEVISLSPIIKNLILKKKLNIVSEVPILKFQNKQNLEKSKQSFKSIHF